MHGFYPLSVRIMHMLISINTTTLMSEQPKKLAPQCQGKSYLRLSSITSRYLVAWYDGRVFRKYLSLSAWLIDKHNIALFAARSSLYYYWILHNIWSQMYRIQKVFQDLSSVFLIGLKVSRILSRTFFMPSRINIRGSLGGFEGTLTVGTPPSKFPFICFIFIF